MQIYILPYGCNFRGGGSTGQFMKLLDVIVSRVKKVGNESATIPPFHQKRKLSSLSSLRVQPSTPADAKTQQNI